MLTGMGVSVIYLKKNKPGQESLRYLNYKLYISKMFECPYVQLASSVSNHTEM